MRTHVLEVCTRLVADHGLDGLKPAFLDDATVYTDDGGDPVGPAMALLLGDLSALCPRGPLVELRQPCFDPGMSAYGNLLRDTDCPADATANRIRAIEAALCATGGAVHSDTLMNQVERDGAFGVGDDHLGVVGVRPDEGVQLVRTTRLHLATLTPRPWSPTRVRTPSAQARSASTCRPPAY